MPKEIIEKKEPAKKSFFKKLTGFILNLCILAAVAFGGYAIYKNPQMIERYTEAFKGENSTSNRLNDLSRRTDVLQSELEVVSNIALEPRTDYAPSIQALRDKIDQIEELNRNSINSKADVANVLGLITRVDGLEEKTNKIAKISDQGALVLTAAMLVKDQSEKGGEFAFEAEILNQLALDDVKIKDSIDIITTASTTGVVSNQELINDFNRIYYNKIADADSGTIVEELSWKEKIIAKFNEIVQIKKISERTEEDKTRQKLDEIKDHVNNLRFIKAIELIKEYNETGFDTWIEKANSRIAFEKAISKISAYSLALMKVNTLRGN